MICELLQFCGILTEEELEGVSLDDVEEIELNEEQREILEHFSFVFVTCGFQINNPSGLTAIELAALMRANMKFRLKQYQDMFLMQRQILKLPEDIDIESIIGQEEDKAFEILEKIGQMALEE